MKSTFLPLPHIYCHQPFPWMILPTGSTNDHPLDKSLIPHQIAKDLYRGEKKSGKRTKPQASPPRAAWNHQEVMENFKLNFIHQN